MTNFIYYSFHALGFIAVFIYIILASPKYKFPIYKGMILCVLAYASIYAWMLILKIIITHQTGQNIVRTFVFLPLFTLLYSSALGLDKRKSMDLVAPAPCIVQAISHIGCMFPGCCRSWWKVSWGIYNPIVGTKLFPVQLAESLTALIIFIVLVIINKKKNYDFKGQAMPLMLVLFGITRFGWEFLRDNEKLFLHISELALWAIGMAIVGAIWLLIVKIKNNNRKVELNENFE